MTVKERDAKLYRLACRASEWLKLFEGIRACEPVSPQQVPHIRQDMKPVEADILKLADEIRSEDLREAHRDACEDWT